MTDGSAPRLSRWAAPAVVVLVTLAVFWPALRGGFLNWDDDVNILTNPHYRGLGWGNLRWMFTTMRNGPYQPLSWLSLAVDYLFWGMNPLGYHLTNVLLHAANAALFYAVALRFASRGAAPGGIPPRLTAALAALLFAIHPLRVESVAWVTERRDVLSGFFYLGAVYAYLRRHADENPSSQGWQALCWSSFAMALLSKGIVMTLPLVFIVLDVYPLRRLPGQMGQWFKATYRRVWLEKAAYLIPALIIALVAYVGQQRLGSLFVESAAAHCAKACFGLAFYLWKTVWPVDLCPLYESPIPFDPFAWPFLASTAAVALITAALVLARRRWPAGLTAGVCYAVTLAPVLGLVSFGSQLAADRYSYLACLPWPILAAGGGGWAWQRAKAWSRAILCLGAALALTGLAGLTWRQVGVWHDSQTFWEYTLRLRPRTSVAHTDLGNVLAAQGKTAEAAAHYREALRIRPDWAEAHTNLGLLLAGQGRLDEAVAQHREALRIKPDNAEAHNNLGLGLAGQGRVEEAVEHYRAALSIKPELAEAYNNLGNALVGPGRLADAAAQYRDALRINPDYAPAHNNLANVLAAQGQTEASAAQYREALRLAPNYFEAHYNLGLILAKQGKVDEALGQFQEALRIRPGLAPTLRNLELLRKKSGRPQEHR